MRPNKLECLYLAITFQSSLTFAGNTRRLPKKEASERHSNGVQSSLTFAGNTRSLPKKEASERPSNWVGSGLALKF